jgi:hypothetical protein
MIGLSARRSTVENRLPALGVVMLHGMVARSFKLVYLDPIARRSRNEGIPELRRDKFWDPKFRDTKPFQAYFSKVGSSGRSRRESFAIRHCIDCIFDFFVVDCLFVLTTRPNFPSLSHDRASSLQPNRTCLGAVYIRSIRRSCFALLTHSFPSPSSTSSHSSSHSPICKPGTRGSRCQPAEAPTKASLVRMGQAFPRRVPVSCCTCVQWYVCHGERS